MMISRAIVLGLLCGRFRRLYFTQVPAELFTSSRLSVVNVINVIKIINVIKVINVITQSMWIITK